MGGQEYHFLTITPEISAGLEFFFQKLMKGVLEVYSTFSAATEQEKVDSVKQMEQMFWKRNIDDAIIETKTLDSMVEYLTNMYKVQPIDWKD